jgi:hypothetical protein
LGLFRRNKPLHRRLAEEAALDIGSVPTPTSRLSGLLHVMGPPDVFGNPAPLGEVGVHGVPRPRRWDVVASAEAELPGEEVHFVALEDGTLVVDEAVPDGGLVPLAEAIEELLPAPYRALGVRQGRSVWAVAAKRIEVRELPGHEEDELEFLEGDRVVIGHRLEGDVFEVEVSRL